MPTSDQDIPRPGAAEAKFDLAALLASDGADPLALFESHVNPAFASVLRTIGFDARYTSGRGAYLFDARGNRYIDLLGGYAVFNLGRNHPSIADALRQALDLDLPNLPGVGSFRTAGLLARELAAVAPGELGKVFFASGGGEAVDAALKHARAATGRQRVLHCRRSYHGLTMGALSVTANHEFQDGFGQLVPGSTEIPFDDPDALERELLAGGVAAFIVEPIQGKGVNLPGPGYLREAARLCRRHGALLIIDEIQTGLGRTGRMWACE
ncbi:MAG: aminotransferase class III-fold pyridoxal phosphate-dependent enzyme, partial [Phycisphaeraceae bacterium]|nr:aminotransferase class III-fold pyridoxal phosphate-dependent enzyme [Phycisphaeraceae bacterium]